MQITKETVLNEIRRGNNNREKLEAIFNPSCTPRLDKRIVDTLSRLEKSNTIEREGYCFRIVKETSNDKNKNLSSDVSG